MKTFFENLSTTIDSTKIANKGGLGYLSAATAVQLADLATVDFVNFGDQPYLPLFDGAVVAIDLPILETRIQRTWLPIMDKDNRCIALKDIQVTDVNNSRQRALVKALATVYGVGMSIFLGADGDGPKAVAKLGLSPESDLKTASAVFDTLENDGIYLSWSNALAAARIVDPTFHWHIVEWEGLPYRKVLNGVQVDIECTFKGKKQCLSLPIMDESFNAVPANKVTVWLWNRTVMRLLSKAIAFTTGYGLEVYSEEFGNSAKPAKDSTNDSSSTQAGEGDSKGTSAHKPAAAKSSTESASASSAPVAAADVRFKEIMKKRFQGHGMLGLISLFDALAESTKFTDEEKEMCRGLLISGIASLGNAEQEFLPSEMLALFAKHNAMAYVPQDSKELVRMKLIKVCIERALLVSNEELIAMPEALLSGGLIADIEEFAKVAELAEVNPEVMDFFYALSHS